MRTKTWIAAVLVLGIAGFVHAQGVRVLELRGGYLNPKGTNAGLIFGGSYGVSIDERVDLSLGFSVFHKGYQKETAVADTGYQSGINERTVMRELEYSTTLLPIFVGANVRFPFQPPLYWYVGGSLTYQFLFNTENNFQEEIKEKRNYRGWGWMVRAGIEYTIGSRSSVLMEAFYNIGKVKRNVKETVEGLPVWDEVDVSGLGFRAGLRLEFF